MRWLLFLSRVAFICNVFFVLVVSLQFTNWTKNQDVISLVVMLGYVMAALFNPIVNLCYLIWIFISRKKLDSIPKWIIVANILFLVMQLFYILYLNDTRTA